MILLFLLPLVLGAPYEPGTPGAPWTEQELLTVKAKLFKWFRGGNAAPGVVRLGFHDCLKYKDGTGGCDGCLNWHGMEHRFGADGVDIAHTRAEENVDEGNNNGLEGPVRVLEKLYTKKDWPGNSPSLEVSLRDSGKSRADLWAFAALMAVEFGKDTTNIACLEGDSSARIPSGSLCLHNFGEPSCSVTMPRGFKFQTGRADCVERDAEFGYKATKEEVHPNPVGNGQSTIEFFRDSFSMTGREVVALMGAHTFGKPHFKISMFPYTWTSKATNLWTNDYYKAITGRPRWFFSPAPGDACNKVGDAFGNIPRTRWLAHTRMCTKRGGPVFWIHENLVCPDCTRDDIRENDKCCRDVPEGQFCKADRAGPEDPDTSKWSPFNTGCERFRFISGADEIALNAEMGLYREFEVTDGVIHGCPGLEPFAEMRNTSIIKTIWSKGEDNWNGEPRCEKQRLEEPAGSGEPLYTIFEEYADDQSAWMRDYVPAMEKMLANGYDTGLVDAPDFTTGVVCPFPEGKVWETVWFCYKNESPGSGPAYVIRSDCPWDGFETKGRVVQAGAKKEEMWSFTGADNQLWKWSESGNMLINVATGKPFAVGGFTEWRVARPKQGDILETQFGDKALDAWVARDNGCGGALIVGNKHGDGGQWFSLVEAEQFVADPSLDCPPTTPAPATTLPPTTTAAPTTTTPAPTTTLPTTIGSVSVECTEDGSTIASEQFTIQNVRDSYVMADDGSGTTVLQKRDTSDLSASSLQTWQYAPLCNGKFKVVNVGTGNPLSSGPWKYDPESKVLQAETGSYARSIRRGHKFTLEKRVRYLKGTTTPWKWFQWDLFQV